MLYRRFFNVPNWGFSKSFREFDRLRSEMDELFGALSSGTLPRLSAGVFPLTNVTEDKENYYVRAELPGIKSNELDIQVTAEGISISGERKIPVEGNNVRYHRREREAGKFSRSINLPGEIDVNKVEASMKNGVLKVTIPKSEAAKPRQITVK
ncbi:MAG: Hsp20/alpha crystallin family protein [Deltaproteobacteria bacterium]|nr:MAG: Hsp20/alpha crystallin family protein [Deltaproteobacteria bacterium]